MTQLNLTKEVTGTVEQTVGRLTEALQSEGFGVLTRIDFHSKIKEKLGKDVPPTVILGACNPQLAYEAYRRTPEVTGLVPCNAVVRQLAEGRVAVELAKPTALLSVLGDAALVSLASEADQRLRKVLSRV